MQQRLSQRLTNPVAEEGQVEVDRIEHALVRRLFAWRVLWRDVLIEVVCVAGASKAHDLDAACRHANHLQAALMRLRVHELEKEKRSEVFPSRTVSEVANEPGHSG